MNGVLKECLSHIKEDRWHVVYGYKYLYVSNCCKDGVSTNVTSQGASKSLQRLRASSIVLHRDHSGNFKPNNNNAPGSISESRVEDTNQGQILLWISWKSMNRIET